MGEDAMNDRTDTLLTADRTITVYTRLDCGWVGTTYKRGTLTAYDNGCGLPLLVMVGRKPRARGDSETYLGKCAAVVVEGKAPERPVSLLAETTTTGDGVRVSRSRYRSADPQWDRDFDAWLSGQTVALDTRAA